MPDRYPGYEVLAKRTTPSWNRKTREVIDQRLAIVREPRFFNPVEWRTLQALCARILPQPQDRPAVPLPAFVDEKLYTGQLDGFRYAQLPPQGQAWRRGLAALNAEAQAAHAAAFERLSSAEQDELLARMQRGELSHPAWGDMPSKLFFQHRVIPDVIHPYYAHPAAWNEIGFGGPAAPRGYVRMGLNRRDPWEAVETHPVPGERVP
jgi:Gluconate 2-dehydrogenase subunit 3